MITPLAVNTVTNHQHLLQQVQQHLPAMFKPVEATFQLNATHAVDETPQDRSEQDTIDIHSNVDYNPWLHHLYRVWQHALVSRFGNLPHHHTYDEQAHWIPETAAHHLNDLALHYLGVLQHKYHINLLDSMTQLTTLWQEIWHINQQEIEEIHANIGIKQALDNTAIFFHEFWLGACLILAQHASASSSE